MVEENIDRPVIPRLGEEIREADLPECYRDFQTAWQGAAKEAEKRSEGESRQVMLAETREWKFRLQSRNHCSGCQRRRLLILVRPGPAPSNLRFFWTVLGNCT